MQFLAPLSDRDIVLGKTVAGGLLSGISILMVLAALLILAPSGSPLSWAAALVGCASMYILLAPVAVFSSAVFPKPADLSKMGKAGNAHGVAGFIGFILTLAVAVPPGLFGMAGLILESPLLALGLNLAWALIAAAIAYPLLLSAAKLVGERRENLALVAQGR